MSITKLLLSSICIFTLTQSLNAQWSNGSTVTTTSLNVGIGTTTPRGKLDIWGGSFHVTGTDHNGTLVGGSQGGYAWISNDYLNNGISISPTGKVGIGTASTIYELDVKGTAKADMFDVNNGQADGARLVFRSQGNPEWRVRNFGGLGFFPGEGAPTALWLNYNGSIGINCQDTKGYQLAVNGNAIFTRVVVKQAQNWPDYVFHNNYRLRPLSEVEQYIKQHNHLPEVPSAEDVENDGVDVSDNQAALLKKIEELTLYLIEQNKRIQMLESKIEALQKN